MGKFSKRLIVALTVILAVAAGVFAKTNLWNVTFIDAFWIGGTNQNNFGHYWYYDTYLANKGGPGYEIISEWVNGIKVTKRFDCTYKSNMYEKIILDESQKRGTLGTPDYFMIFKSALGGGDYSPNRGVLEFTNLDRELDPCYPEVSMGTNLTKAPDPLKPIGPDNPVQKPIGENFNYVTHITFRAKVNHPGMLNGIVKFKVETAEQLRHVEESGTTATQKKAAQAPYYAPLKFYAVDEWQDFDIDVIGSCNYTDAAGRNPAPLYTDRDQCVGDLIRKRWENSPYHMYTFDIKDAVRIAWFIEGQDWAQSVGDTGKLEIDYVGIRSYSPSQPNDSLAIEMAKGIIEDTLFDTVLQSSVNTVSEAKAMVEEIIENLYLYGVSTSIVNDTFQAAIAAAKDNLYGTNGSYSFQVALNRGTAAQQITKTLAFIITPNVYTSIWRLDRITPAIDAELLVPINVTEFEFITGPNPVKRSDGSVKFFVLGSKSVSGTLKIYDPAGNAVRKIKIADKEFVNNVQRRVVGSWDLCDSRGRPVTEGTYLVKGVIRTPDKKSEKISTIIGVGQ